MGHPLPTTNTQQQFLQLVMAVRNGAATNTGCMMLAAMFHVLNKPSMTLTSHILRYWNALFTLFACFCITVKCAICIIEMHDLHYWNTLFTPSALFVPLRLQFTIFAIFALLNAIFALLYSYYLHCDLRYRNTIVTWCPLLKYIICIICNIETHYLHYWNALIHYSQYWMPQHWEPGAPHGWGHLLGNSGGTSAGGPHPLTFKTRTSLVRQKNNFVHL